MARCSATEQMAARAQLHTLDAIQAAIHDRRHLILLPGGNIRSVRKWSE